MQIPNNPSVENQRFLPPPFAQGRLFILSHTVTSRENVHHIFHLQGEPKTLNLAHSWLKSVLLSAKAGNYNSKDIGFKSVVSAFFRGLIVTFLADN